MSDLEDFIEASLSEARLKLEGATTEAEIIECQALIQAFTKILDKQRASQAAQTEQGPTQESAPKSEQENLQKLVFSQYKSSAYGCSGHLPSLCGSAVLKQHVDNWREHRDSTKNILTVVQSSGFGKTHACLQLAKTERLVYFPCAKTRLCEQRPNILNCIVEALTERTPDSTNADNDKRRTCKWVVQLLYETANKYEDPQSLYDAQVGGNFYDELREKWGGTKKSVSPDKRTVTFADTRSSSSASASQESAASTAKWLQNKDELIIVFDEAHCLVDSMKNQTSWIRTLYRVLCGTNILGIFLSTNASGLSLLPMHKPSGISPLEDVRNFPNKDDLPVVTEIAFFDVNISSGDSLFARGRPLWKSYWELHGVKMLNEVEALMLKGFASSDEMKFKKRKLAVAFAIRFSYLPRSVNADEFVNHHLATALSVELNEDRSGLNITCTYWPEPPMTEIAARWMHEGDLGENVKMMVEDLAMGSSSILTPNLGDLGERSAAIALQLTLDLCRVPEGPQSLPQQLSGTSLDGTYANDVPVPIFLQALHQDLCPNFDFKFWKDFKVNFSSFTCFDVRERGFQVKRMFSNRIAMLMPPLTAAADILLPVSNGTEEGAILLQIKNHSKKIGAQKTMNLMGDIVDKFLEWNHRVIVVLVTVGGVEDQEMVHKVAGWETLRPNKSFLAISLDWTNFPRLDIPSKTQLSNLARNQRQKVDHPYHVPAWDEQVPKKRSANEAFGVEE